MNVLDYIAQSRIALDYLSRSVAIQKTMPSVSVKNFYQDFLEKNGIQEKQGKNVLFTPGVILGHLYVCLVLPNETYYNQIPQTPLSDLADDKWGNIVIKKGEVNNLQNILRRIRNSLAHNHFSFDDDWTMLFRDGRNNEIEIEMAFNDLIAFTERCSRLWVECIRNDTTAGDH